MASLVARNPTTRLPAGLICHSIKNITEPNIPRLAFPAMNGLYEHFLKQMTGGRMAFLITRDSEFIFGDGFFHNFPSTKNNLSNPVCITPLHPDVSVMWLRPSSGYFTQPRTMSALLDTNMVTALNYTIQIYSNEYVYFRKTEPELIDIFKEPGHHRFSSKSGDNQKEIIQIKRLALECEQDNALSIF